MNNRKRKKLKAKKISEKTKGSVSKQVEPEVVFLKKEPEVQNLKLQTKSKPKPFLFLLSLLSLLKNKKVKVKETPLVIKTTHRNEQSVSSSVFPIVIRLGGDTKEELIKKVQGQGYLIVDNALRVIESTFIISNQKRTVTLKKSTLPEMGFTPGEHVSWKRIKEWIIQNGRFCDDEVGLRLRLILKNQPLGEDLAIANEYAYIRIMNTDYHDQGKCIFRNGCDGYWPEVYNLPPEDQTFRPEWTFVYQEK